LDKKHFTRQIEAAPTEVDRRDCPRNGHNRYKPDARVDRERYPDNRKRDSKKEQPLKKSPKAR
jgi:hypothetical protein